MFERETKREKSLEIRNNQRKRENPASRRANGDAPSSAHRGGPNNASNSASAALAAALKADEKLENQLKQVEAEFFKSIEMKEPLLSAQGSDNNDQSEVGAAEDQLKVDADSNAEVAKGNNARASSRSGSSTKSRRGSCSEERDASKVRSLISLLSFFCQLSPSRKLRRPKCWDWNRV